MPCTEYSTGERAQLLAIARASMTQGVRTGRPISVDTRRLPPALTDIRCTFVTLRSASNLRGCTGSLKPIKPLAIDVADVACQTLFDPRFSPVSAHEVDRIDIEISVLSPLTELPVISEVDLLARLQPDVDGLVLIAGAYSATLLPKVWESLPDPRQFVSELKGKAGLSPDFWSDDIRLYRYHTETFSETNTRTVQA